MVATRSLWTRITQHPLVLRYTCWEYFPIWLANIPLVFIWLYFSLRARHPLFFTAANPAIDTAGLFGESKMEILDALPAQFIPTSIFIPSGTAFSDILQEIKTAQLQYPIIAKPDIGERGQMVAKIKNEQALANYCDQLEHDFIIQAFVDYPEEVSVLYHRMPDERSGHIPSFCLKEHLHVIGDGKSTIQALMQTSTRANLQINRFLQSQPALLATIPAKSERIELEPIGNHSRGTMFLNGNPLIDDDLLAVFDPIADQLEGIYYGRYDIKCSSIEDLKKGRNFLILELNGIAGEAAHIYDPSYPIWKKYRDVFRCWKAIFEISQFNRKVGFEYPSLRDFYQKFQIYRSVSA